MKNSEKEEIFLEVIDKYSNQIHRVCWGFTNNAEDIKDLYQDVTINIWKGIEGFQNRSSLSTWIHRITINTCILWEKRKSSLRMLKDKIPSIEQANYEDMNLEENPKLIVLKSTIDKLKIVDKTLILLVLEELSYKEIAKITGLSISNIGTKINRIKSRLKKHLNNN